MARKSKHHKTKLASREYLSFNHPELEKRLLDYSVNYVSNLASTKSWKVDTKVIGNRRYICPETTMLMLKLGLNEDGALKLYMNGSVDMYGFQDEIKDTIRGISQGSFSFARINESTELAVSESAYYPDPEDLKDAPEEIGDLL